MIKAEKKPYERVILVCINERPKEVASCGGRGSVEIFKKIKSIVKAKGLSDRIRVTRTQCLGLCDIGPNITIFPDNVWYNNVTPEDIDEIIRIYVIGDTNTRVQDSK